VVGSTKLPCSKRTLKINLNLSSASLFWQLETGQGYPPGSRTTACKLHYSGPGTPFFLPKVVFAQFFL